MSLPHVAAIVAGLVVCGACASTGARPAPFPRPESGPASVSGTRAAPSDVAGTALSQQGVPYRPGGGDPTGFDCSGLVAYVLARHGLEVPRTVRQQYGLGRRVPVHAVQPGDLVFFSTIAPGPSHVGIAISATAFVHAPSSAGVVRVEDLGAPYWRRRFVGARRLH